jgi:hypothetical protein
VSVRDAPTREDAVGQMLKLLRAELGSAAATRCAPASEYSTGPSRERKAV